MSKLWLPFPPSVLKKMGRCPGCGCHPVQGHKEGCPKGMK